MQQTNAELGDLLKKVEQEKEGLDQYQAAVLREAARCHFPPLAAAVIYYSDIPALITCMSVYASKLNVV